MDEKILRIKAAADAAGSAHQRLLKRDAYQSTLEAHDIVDRARARAAEIVAGAEREGKDLRAQAREEGYREGLAAWNERIAEASRRSEALAEEWRRDLGKLAIAIARKLIGAELTLRPEAIVDLVLEALKSAGRARQLTIQVNTAEAESVRDSIARLKGVTGANRDIDVIGSAAVERGGCIVESEFGFVDARLDTQLRCLEDLLTREARP